MAPRQPSMSNIADPDNSLGCVPCLLSRLSANGQTARPFGPALLALNLSGIHSVARVPFFPLLTLFPRLCLSLVSLRILALSGLALRVFAGRLLLIYRRYIPFLELSRSHGCELHHRAACLSLTITRCGGIYSLVFVCFE